jgi:Translation initiation factor IF-2, N-terminal region
MSTPGKERISKSPPSGHAGKTVYLVDSMTVKDLASVLKMKPFKIVADLMELGLFKSPVDSLNFETACQVARKHGFQPERPPPGVLVL